MTNIKNMKEGFSKNYKLFSLFLITTEPKEVFIGQKMKEGKRKEKKKNEFFFCAQDCLPILLDCLQIFFSCILKEFFASSF
jgi:hypothetical protein